MAEQASNSGGLWKTRYSIILLLCSHVCVLYRPRQHIVAIIPMAEEFKWDLETQASFCRRFMLAT